MFYHELLRDYSPDEEMKTKLQEDPNVLSYSVCLKSSRSHEECFWNRLAFFTKHDMESFHVILQQRSRL